MADLELPRDAQGHAAQATAQGASQHLALNDTFTRTASAFATSTKLVRLAPDVDCYYRFGNSAITVNRTGGGSFLAAGGVEYRSLKAGMTHLAVIKKEAATNDGVMNIEETY